MANSLAISCAAVVAAASISACNDPKSSPAPASSASSAPSAAPAPPPPKPARIFVTADAVIVGDQRFSTADSSFAPLSASAVSGEPLVTGATVEVDADRKAKLAGVFAVFSGLKRASAKAEVHTTTRDGQDVSVVFSFPKAAPDCAVVADIAKDAAVSVWTVGGLTAKRFTHGFAGPDITLGTDAVRKLAAGCDASVWFLSADESIPWGSVFDLAASAMGAADGGTPMRTPDVAVLPTEAVPGRKVTLQ